MAKYGKGKAPCMPTNTNLTFEASNFQIGTKKNDSVSSLSLEKKSIKIGKK